MGYGSVIVVIAVIAAIVVVLIESAPSVVLDALGRFMNWRK